jgi:hypothetical protein
LVPSELLFGFLIGDKSRWTLDEAKIVIGLPVFNGADYLPEALDLGDAPILS